MSRFELSESSHKSHKVHPTDADRDFIRFHLLICLTIFGAISSAQSREDCLMGNKQTINVLKVQINGGLPHLTFGLAVGCSVL